MKASKIILGLLLLVNTGFSQEFEDSPFGFHPASVVIPGYPDNGLIDAQNIGVGWHRPPAYAFWFAIQPDLNDSTYDWTMYDRQYGSVPQGIQILANISADHPRNPHGYTLPGSHMPIDEGKYTTFVRATVERYDGDGIDDMPGLTNPVTHWQVGNEPNVQMTSDFAGLQHITYLAIKEACQECTVLIGGVAGFPDNYISKFESDYLPILTELAGEYVDVFDFHWYGTAFGDYRFSDSVTGEDVYDYIQNILTAKGFPSDLPVWITEMCTYSGNPSEIKFSYQSEAQQASDLFKRFIYPLSRGVNKIFPAFGLGEGMRHVDGYFDHTGLIYNGQGSNDLGAGVKKLGYFTYKFMTEKLKGCNWNSVQTLIDGTGNVYAYIFAKVETGEPIYVAWWDWFDGPTYVEGNIKTLNLSVGDVDSVTITKAVPDVESGADLDAEDYPNFFATERRPVANGVATVTLGENPVFVEMSSLPTSVGEQSGSLIPEGFKLEQNYPNPFNPQTTIEYQLPLFGRITLRIYNVLGKKVKTLVDENKPVGSFSVLWDGKDNLGDEVTSGVYFLQMRTKDFAQTKRLLFLK